MSSILFISQHHLAGPSVSPKKEGRRKEEEHTVLSTPGVPGVALLADHNERVEDRKSDATTIYVVSTVSTSDEGKLHGGYGRRNSRDAHDSARVHA